jgi:small subunit ribosomal protein S16
MAVKLRLARMGAKKRPFYRVVAADERACRDGKFLETLGHYDPTARPKVISIDRQRLDYWVGVGAQLSDTVRRLLRGSDGQPADASAK